VATGDVAGAVVVGDAMGIIGVEVGNVDIAGDAMSELSFVVEIAVVGGAADITGAVTVGDVVGVVVVVGVDIVGVNSCDAQHASICTRLASSLLLN
jgi:hypothetical protein